MEGADPSTSQPGDDASPGAASDPVGRSPAAEGPDVAGGPGAIPVVQQPDPIATRERPPGRDSAEPWVAEAQAATARGRRERRLLVLVAAVGVVLWIARPVLGPFVVAAVLAYAFSPLVAAGEQRLGLPRVAVIAIGYVVAFVALAVLLYLGGGALAREVSLLTTSGPDLIGAGLRQLFGADTITLGNMHVPLRDVVAQVQGAVSGILASPGDAVHIAGTVADVVLQAVLVVVVLFYFLLDGGRFMTFGLRFLPALERDRVRLLFDRIHLVLARWLRGELLLIALVSAVVYVFLGPILHIHYALVLAVVTGVLEIIPLVGPIVAAALAAIVALGQAGTQTAIVVVIFYFVLRQVEDQLVMPVVIGRAVHLHPVVTIFAVLVGLSAWGILGALLGVPVAAALNVTLRELYPEARTDTA